MASASKNRALAVTLLLALAVIGGAAAAPPAAAAPAPPPGVPAPVLAHTCIHDDMMAQRRAANFTEPRHLTEYGENGRRRLQQSGAAPTYAPIRIKAIYLGDADTGSAGGSPVSAALSSYLKTQIM